MKKLIGILGILCVITNALAVHEQNMYMLLGNGILFFIAISIAFYVEKGY
jgi:thiosulfate reductase cytochrome b subunit